MRWAGLPPRIPDPGPEPLEAPAPRPGRSPAKLEPWEFLAIACPKCSAGPLTDCVAAGGYSLGRRHYRIYETHYERRRQARRNRLARAV